MMVRSLLDSRPGDFHITAVDQSEAMAQACAQRAGDTGSVQAFVARAEDMPFPANSFDVVLGMGVLEYSNAERSMAEISRVVRPGGWVLISMLNPASPYRYVQWHVYPILQQVVGLIETAIGVPAERRHKAIRPVDNGIQAYRGRALQAMAARAGLDVVDAPAFDVTYLVPPIDRIVRRWARGWQRHPEGTISRSWTRHLGTAYLLVARKAARADGRDRLAGRAATANPDPAYR